MSVSPLITTVPAVGPDTWGFLGEVPIDLTENRYLAAVEMREINDIPADIPDPDVTTTFAKYVHNHAIGVVDNQGGQQGGDVHGRVEPYNPEGYLLISAGPDGVYGTNDDIKNFGER